MGPDIVLFQEAWLYSSDKIDLCIPGYSVFQKSSMKIGQARKGRRFGGLLTYVKSGLTSQCVEHKNTRLLPVQVGGVCVVNAYMPYNGHEDETLYFRCLNDIELLRSSHQALVLAGDM